MRHISPRQFLVLVSILGTTLTTSHVSAQEAPGSNASTTTTQASASMPKPGSTMQIVKEKFGSPSQEIPAVGTPAISRWEYPSYVVYFENDRVLHTVIK